LDPFPAASGDMVLSFLKLYTKECSDFLQVLRRTNDPPRYPYFETGVGHSLAGFTDPNDL
jgi:hypothetical protein